jgi:signal transduction histidine kinase
MATTQHRLWRYIRGLAAPVLLWGLVVVVLAEVLPAWLGGDEDYDARAIREWIDEASAFRESLPQMAADYLDQVARARASRPGADASTDPLLRLRAEKIEEHLTTLGTMNKMYRGQQPLFPFIYRMQVNFDDQLHLPPIVWDSGEPRHPTQYRELSAHRLTDQASVTVQYQLHAYNKRQRDEQRANTRLRWLSVLAVAGTLLAFAWMYLVQRRERERDHQRLLTLQQIDQAQRRQEEAERKLLGQQLATQDAERQALELKSQLYASIGIMAGSYAHNIKNLLVRPNDLLRRCLEADGVPTEQEQMLQEVRQTLGTVTERLQQILRTVRRDPSRPELTRIDLNDLARELERTWKDLAHEKWKLDLTLDLSAEPLPVEGDWSHLQQAVENLLFNARDATFEMRNYRRDQARKVSDLEPPSRRQALIAAAGWKGTVLVRTRRDNDHAVIEVQDNGIGMTEEVRRRCTETHFTTKRDNAIYEGNSTGMGLGLSFVAVILQHHHAALEIQSRAMEGTTFRATFPMSATASEEMKLKNAN